LPYGQQQVPGQWGFLMGACLEIVFEPTGRVGTLPGMSQPGGAVVSASSVPAIYSPHIDVERLSVAHRLGAALLAIAVIAPLCIGSQLFPSPTGIGTHTQISGMQKCWFEARTGIPCPSCGMTTSFAYFARGNIVASFYIQPMGCVLAALSIMAFWTGMYLALTGRPVHRLLDRLPVKVIGLFFMWFGLTAWAWKIYIHITHRDGW
jgi:hypothetical protein